MWSWRNWKDLNDNKPVTLIVDASGLTVSNKGDYIEEKWISKKKEFIKLLIAVDGRSENVMSFTLIKKSAKKHNIDKVYGDKTYDDRKNFNILDEINAEPAISITKNAIHHLH